MKSRRLPLMIPEEDYQRLVDIGKREERDPIQQARYLLRKILRTSTSLYEEHPDGQTGDSNAQR